MLCDFGRCLTSSMTLWQALINIITFATMFRNVVENSSNIKWKRIIIIKKKNPNMLSLQSRSLSKLNIV